MPFYTHHMSPAEYGVVSLIYAFIAFMNIFYHYGLESAFLRFYSQADDKTEYNKKDVFSTVIVSLMGTSVLFSGLLLIFAEPVSRVILHSVFYANLVRLTGGILFLDTLFLIPLHYLRMTNKPVKFTGVTLMNVLINVSLNIYLISFRGKGIEAVFISNLFASGFNVLVLIPVVVKNYNHHFMKGLWKKLILFGLPFIPSGLSSMIIELSDRYMIEGYRDLHDVGLYSAGHKLGIFVMLIVMAFRFAWQPFFLNKRNDPDAPELFSKIMTWFLFLMTVVFLAVCFFIQDLVGLQIMGRHIIEPNYWGGLIVVPLISAAYIFYGIYINLQPGIFYTGKTWVVPIIIGTAAVVNIGLNLFLIPRIGIAGAGVSSLAAYIVMSVFTYFKVRTWMKVDYEWGKLLCIFICTGISLVVFYTLQPQSFGIKFLILLIDTLLTLAIIFPGKGRKSNVTA